VNICQVDGCSNEVLVKSRGLCKMHYHRFMRTGKTGLAEKARVDGDPAERWMELVDVQSPGCWIWTSEPDKNGYGQFNVVVDGKRKNWRAHRWVYTVLVRPLEPGETLDHLCRVHACVNPDHCEPVSHAVNCARGHAGGRYKNRDMCKNGHQFTEANTIWRGSSRECLVCEGRPTRPVRQRASVELPTHCSHGHEFTPENTLLRPGRGRVCRICNRARVAAWRERERQRA
jgi:hypothetical protein